MSMKTHQGRFSGALFTEIMYLLVDGDSNKSEVKPKGVFFWVIYQINNNY